MLWSRILVPTDFSTAAEWAIDEAVRVAVAASAELVLLHVRLTDPKRPEELRFPADPALYDYVEAQEMEALRQRLGAKASRLRMRLVTRQGPDAATEICRVAASEAAGLIVIATHGQHRVSHLLIGSTTMSVLTHATAPVLAIRYGTRRRAGFNRLVVPVHLKQTTFTAVELAAGIAAENGGHVHLLTVCRDRDRSEAEQLQSRLAAEKLAGIETTKAIVNEPDLDRAVLRYAHKVDADLIVLHAEREPIGAIKQDIIRHVDRPVIVVPAG